MGKAPDELREEIEETRARMGDTVEALGYKADVPARTRERVTDAKESVAGRVSSVKERVVGSATSAKDSVADTTTGAKERVRSAVPDGRQVGERARRTASVAQENPVGLALGSVALGFLAGLVFPSTRVEDERLGPIADEVKERARETGQEAVERGREAAQQVSQSATETVKHAAQNVAETAREAGQQHAEELRQSAQEKAQEASHAARGQAGGQGGGLG